MKAVINSFGEEWNRFDQERFLPSDERRSQFLRYFNTPHFKILKSLKKVNAIDIGAGSGRWSSEIIHHLEIERLTLVEPSSAFKLLKKIFSNNNKVSLINESIEDLLIKNKKLRESFDLVYCFGVLHHTSSISKGFSEICKFAKPGGIIFCYLYYNLDNRPIFYKLIYSLSILPRIFISRLPSFLKNCLCDLIAIFIYLPFVNLARLFPKNKSIPLNSYADRSFFSIRTDSRDRFGTRVERRISKIEIKKLCLKNGLEDIQFSEDYPYWVFSAKKI